MVVKHTDFRPLDQRGPYKPARDLAQTFAERIRALKLASGMTVREIADRGGIPSGTVQKLLSAGQLPTLHHLLALQRSFELASVEELLGSLPSATFNALPSVALPPTKKQK